MYCLSRYLWLKIYVLVLWFPITRDIFFFTFPLSFFQIPLFQNMFTKMLLYNLQIGNEIHDKSSLMFYGFLTSWEFVNVDEKRYVTVKLLYIRFSKNSKSACQNSLFFNKLLSDNYIMTFCLCLMGFFLPRIYLRLFANLIELRYFRRKSKP